MYDVFISFKNTIDGKKENPTEDSYIAEELYKELTNRSIKTFFSKYEIEHDKWWPEISRAISQARVFVLFGTSLNYIRAAQVKREWVYFLDEVGDGNKPGCELFPYWRDSIDRKLLKPEERELTHSNIYDIDAVSVIKLCDKIQSVLPQSVATPKDEVTEYIQKNNKKTDRFNYRNGYTKLLGREEEIDFLKRFCTETNYPVSWTIISGKGGIGKSKLSYDFCRMMEREGWNVFYPAHATSFSGDVLAKTDRECLICFDYVKFELDIIKSIIQLAIDRRIRYKIRFILIERNASEIIGGFSSVINEYHFPGGDLKLSAPENEKILDIVENYITNISNDKVLGKKDKENIMSSLEMVDPGIKRPLFAMFIADAWIDDSFELEDWNRERAVGYVANKELDRIRSAASAYANNQADKELYLKSLYLFVLFATFCGGVDSIKIIDTVKELTDINDHAANILLDGSELRIKDKIKGIEPDLVGEYICINILNNLKPELVRQFFETMYKSMFIDMVSYIDKIYDDYTDPFLSADWSSYVTSISIPLTYTYIKNNMFNGCGFIREVKLHDQVTTISHGAFRDCDHLYKINFPDNLEIIESAAFLNCVALETAMPDDGKGWVPSIVRIGDRAFKNCRELRNIKIPSSVKEIGTEIFAKCKSIEEVELPKDITTIPYNAFEACESLVTVIFKSESRDGITIQSEAFKDCVNLRNVKNSNSITYIGKSGFENCYSLRNIIFSKKLSDFGEGAFKGCKGLEIVDLSSTGIKSISKSLFEECEGIESVKLSCELTHIGARAFFNCLRLQTICLPESIKGISELAFSGCCNLKSDSFGDNAKNIRSFGAFTVKNIDDEFIDFLTSYYGKREVMISRNITRIGKKAFFNDAYLERLICHADVSEIGKEAFRECACLKKIEGTFSGVKKIGEGAFWGCKELQSLPGDANVTKIEDNLFRFCSSLETIRVRSEIENIGKYAFSHCYELKRILFKGKCSQISLAAFEYCPKLMLSPQYHIKNKGKLFYVAGFIFRKFDHEEMRFVSKYREQENVSIPFSCVGFFENPFENSRIIKRIVVPKSVRSLIKYNFAKIPSLESIKIPDSIKILPESLFEGCNSLKTIEIGSETNSLQNGIRIGKRIFADCYSLKEMKLPSELKRIEDGLFYGCKGLETINFNDGLEKIGNQAFLGCSSITSIELPSSLQLIEFQAFENCVQLECVIGLENTKVDSLPNEAFQGCIRLKEIYLPIGMKSLGPHAFYDCQHIEKLDIFKTEIEYIGIAAFQNCYMLKEMVFPRRIKVIENFLLKSCTQLKKVKIPPSIEEIHTSAFFGCNQLLEIDFHNKRNLTRIDNDAFAGCHRIENISLPDGLKKLTRGLFRECVSLKRVEIPDGIHDIPVDCFKDCKQLEEIIASTKISSVRAGAFRNCFGLKDLLFAKHANVCEVAAFRGCIGVENVVLDKVDTLSPAVFMGCYNLKSVSVPQIRQIDNYAFYGCVNLEEVPIENVKMKIGAGAFWNCSKLKKVIFSNEISDIQPSAFRNCESIEEVKFPVGLNKIHAASFRGDNSLAYVFVPKTVSEIHKSAFRDCVNLEEVKVESEYVRIEKTAFGDCPNLYYFDFDGSIQAQSMAFNGTPIEEDLKKDSRVEWIEQEGRLRLSTTKTGSEGNNISASKAMELFLYSVTDGDISIDKYIGKNKQVIIPDTINGLTVTHIGDACFEDRRDVSEIGLPITIESIGKNAFTGCKSLEHIDVPASVLQIGEYAFKWCSKLVKFTIPPRVTEILQGTFMCCYSLESIELHNNIRHIGEAAFWRCENLRLKIPETAIIDVAAFKGMDKSSVEYGGVLEDRFFEEWPFGEEVNNKQYGYGIVIGCEFIDKTKYRLLIHFDGNDVSMIYPEAFKESTVFVLEENNIRYQEFVERTQDLIEVYES
jgi:hypothetical protein